MSDELKKGSIRTFVLMGNGLPLQESTVHLGWKAVVVDDTPNRQALFFTFDGPGTLTLQDRSGKEVRHFAPAADAMFEKGPIFAWIE
jgi:hypothetical protein